ncbi:MAG: shikimate dehydrogenase [Robiginitomaculum sp.]|nr:MAG: shikimate dehydrogenase [Robiginitomaculum sp.]
MSQSEQNKKRPFACVVGDPIAHSLSPLLHQTWLRALGIDAEYRRLHVSSADFEKEILAFFENKNFVGMNVTLPHKKAALEVADMVSEEAKSAGAANSLVQKGDQIYAHNTDIEGFIAPLLAQRPEGFWRGKQIVIIGGGGAAQAAIIGALKLNPQQIVLSNRTNEKAAKLEKRYENKVQALLWQERHDALPHADLIINASAGGMTGKSPLSLSLEGLNKGALVYDLIYTPLQTPLLAEAKVRGHDGLNGLDMLIAQARPSFEAFFGHKAPTGIGIKRVLEQALEKRP